MLVVKTTDHVKKKLIISA